MILTHRFLTPGADHMPTFDRELYGADRVAAGQHLAQLLLPTRDSQAIVLALPPGGLVVASETARVLRLPLDVLLVRTFAIRPYPQLVAGALSEGGGLCLNRTVLRLPDAALSNVWQEVRRTMHELQALNTIYRHGRSLPPLQRRTVILIDDGLGDGLAQLAALAALRHLHLARCIVATPLANPMALHQVAQRADQVVVLQNNSTLPGGAAWQHSIDDETAAAILAQDRGHASSHD
jgi:putative phosphoribosyl transferase